MAKRDLKSILVRMPTTLKRRLAREVARRRSTLNDVAVDLLAGRFGVEFEPSGRSGPVPGATGVVLLRVPPELKRRLDAAARERDTSTNSVVVESLAERLDVSLHPGKDTMPRRNGSENGKTGRSGKVRVAIIGVGNCANSLLQGVEYYKDAPPDEFVPGLMHVDLGGYHVRDVEFTAAFDVSKAKVGKDLSEIVEKAPGDTDDVVRILQETGTDVVVNYLPVGSEEATKWYTEQILNAGCAMVNCMPVFIAKGGYFGRQFEERGLPIIGDDIKSQVGATITHRVLTSLFRERGVRLDRTMQLNVGGNSDFLNMLERERLESKKISKTNAVTSMLDYDLGEGN